MEQKENIRQILQLEIVVISKSNEILSEIKNLIKKHQEKFSEYIIDINSSIILSSNLISKLKFNNILFIDAELIAPIRNTIFNNTNRSFEVVLVKNSDISHSGLMDIFRFFEYNSLNLLGSIDTDNLSPNMVRYLTLDFILKKINESN